MLEVNWFVKYQDVHAEAAKLTVLPRLIYAVIPALATSKYLLKGKEVKNNRVCMLVLNHGLSQSQLIIIMIQTKPD